MLTRLRLHRPARHSPPDRAGDRRRRENGPLQGPPAPGPARRARAGDGRAQHRAPRLGHFLLPFALSLLLAGCGSHGRPGLQVGAVEDAAKWVPNPASPMKLAQDANFRSVLLSAVWKRGARAEADLPPLRRAVKAAVAAAVQPMLTVYQFSSSTPLSDVDRSAFAAYAAAIARALPDVHVVFVGNEPNLNLFWQPQFDDSGGDAAAKSYEQLLATTYDALKQVDT